MSAAPKPRPDPETPVTPELVAQHGLSEAEYDRVVTILGRQPNLLELGIFTDDEWCVTPQLHTHVFYRSCRICHYPFTGCCRSNHGQNLLTYMSIDFFLESYIQALCTQVLDLQENPKLADDHRE